jgi:hypothetical protein
MQEREQGLGSTSSASSQAGLGLQYASAGPWSGSEPNRLHPAGEQAAAQALWHLLGRMFERDLILLSASSNAGGGSVERSGVQSDENTGQMLGWNTTKENGEVVIGNRHEAQRLYGKQLVYYEIELQVHRYP